MRKLLFTLLLALACISTLCAQLQPVEPTPIVNDPNNPPPANGGDNYMVWPTARALKFGCVYQDAAKTIPLPGVQYIFTIKPRRDDSGGHLHVGQSPNLQLFTTTADQSFSTSLAIRGVTGDGVHAPLGCGAIQQQFPNISGWYTTTFTYTYTDSQGHVYSQTYTVNDNAQGYDQPNLSSPAAYPFFPLEYNVQTMQPFFEDQFHNGGYSLKNHTIAQGFWSTAALYHNYQVDYWNNAPPIGIGWDKVQINSCSLDYGGMADDRYRWDGAWTPWATPRGEAHHLGAACDFWNPNKYLVDPSSQTQYQQWLNLAAVSSGCFPGKNDRNGNYLGGASQSYTYWGNQPYTHYVCGVRDDQPPPTFPATN